MRCDGIAVITMNRMGVDSERLVSAATKLARHNERLGPPNDARYVPLDDRVRFIRALARLTASSTLGSTRDRRWIQFDEVGAGKAPVESSVRPPGS